METEDSDHRSRCENEPKSHSNAGDVVLDDSVDEMGEWNDFCKSNIFFMESRLPNFYDIVQNKDIESLLNKDNKISMSTEEVKAHSSSNNFDKSNGDLQENSKNHALKRKKTSLINRIQKNIKRRENITCKFFIECNELKAKGKDSKNFIEMYKKSGPLNRHTWRLLKTLNLDNLNQPFQYLNTDHGKVKVMGAKGDIDLNFNSYVKLNVNDKPTTETKEINKTDAKPLLTAMSVNFKPGPLSRKPSLGYTNNVKIATIPRVQLQIQPKIGKRLPANLCNNLKQIRHSDGYIDHAWADFATSTIVGTLPEQKTLHTFVLPFKNNQNKILVRQGSTELRHSITNRSNRNIIVSEYDLDSKLENLSSFGLGEIDEDVRSIISDMIKSISIGEIQDGVFQVDPDMIDTSEKNAMEQMSLKQSRKRKYLNELEKLNVTVINMDEETPNVECTSEFCKLSCICASLKNYYVIQNHCGFPECMFECSCKENVDLMNKNNGEIMESAFINIEKKKRENLSKEEKKFQQTVLYSNDQMIVLGMKRRSVKTPKRFDDYALLGDEDEPSMKPRPVVLLPKLPDFPNCEKWCMTHQLYRCFCKGRFVIGNSLKLSSDRSINYFQFNECSPLVSSKKKPTKRTKLAIKETNVKETELNIIDIDHLRPELEATESNTSNLIDVNAVEVKSADLPKLTVPKKKLNQKKTTLIDNEAWSGFNRLMYPDLQKPKILSRTKKEVIKSIDKESKEMLSIDLKTVFETPISLTKNNNVNKKPPSEVKSKPDKVDLSTKEESKDKVDLSTKEESKNKVDLSTKEESKDKVDLSTKEESKDKVDLSTKEESKDKTSPSKESSDPMNYKIVTLVDLMGSYMLNKLNIWITTKWPYKQFITLTSDVYSNKVVNLKYSSKNLLLGHPTFVSDIHNRVMSLTSHVVINCKQLPWELEGPYLEEDDLALMHFKNPVVRYIQRYKWVALKVGPDFIRFSKQLRLILNSDDFARVSTAMGDNYKIYKYCKGNGYSATYFCPGIRDIVFCGPFKWEKGPHKFSLLSRYIDGKVRSWWAFLNDELNFCDVLTTFHENGNKENPVVWSGDDNETFLTQVTVKWNKVFNEMMKLAIDNINEAREKSSKGKNKNQFK